MPKECYVYVLRLKNNGFYVGSTRLLESRLRKHFRTGGAAATREQPPIAVQEVYLCPDINFGGEEARIRVEVFVASLFADEYGSNMVRGAKHGRGWTEEPSENDTAITRRIKRWFKTPSGASFWKLVRKSQDRFESYKKINRSPKKIAKDTEFRNPSEEK